MTQVLYRIVGLIAKIHAYILSLNDLYEYQFNDKELHFLVIGALGMLMIFAIYPVFKYLANRGHILTITSIYVFTVVVVITFAIEIGQKITHTGSMEFADILFGVTGFLAMYLVFATFVGFIKLIKRALIKEEENER